MATSGGGGYCDCGDNEAFLKHHLCSKHAALNVEEKTSQQVLDTFDPDLKARARELLREILLYISAVTMEDRNKMPELLVGKKDKETWKELQYVFDHSKYCLMFCNDNYHSYPQVVNVLSAALKGEPRSSARDIWSLTETIDKEGRAFVKVGSYRECALVSDSVTSNIPQHEQPLKTLVMHTYIVAHQNFTMYLLNWIVELFKKCSGFRALFSEVVLSKSEADLVSIKHNGEHKMEPMVVQFLMHNVRLWKKARMAWFSLTIEGILKEYDSKLEYSRYFMRYYSSIMDHYVNDDQESDCSVVNLTVQLFTVKSIAHILLREENGFLNMISYYRKQLDECAYEQEGELNVDAWMDDSPNSPAKRCRHVLVDIMYLLRAPVDEFDSVVRTSFVNGVKQFLGCLKYFQQIEPDVRRTTQHIEYESDNWKYVEKSLVDLEYVSAQIVKWCQGDRAILGSVTNLATQVANTASSVPQGQRVVKITLNDASQEYSVQDCNIFRESVSSNVPLQRFLGSLLRIFSKFQEEQSSRLKQRLIEHGPLMELIDPTLTAVATLNTITIGLWKRNGISALAQGHLYNNSNLFPGSKRQDLLLLQCVACLLDDPGHLVVALLQRFQLTEWLLTDDVKKIDKLNERVEADDVNHCAEQLLHILVALVLERHIHCVGEVTLREELRHRMIQLLCVEPMSHSTMLDCLQVNEEDYSLVDELLQEIAVLKVSPKNTKKRVFVLKPELLSQFYPFFYSYNQEQASQAFEHQIAAKKSRKERLYFPLHQLPPLTPLFEPLTKFSQALPILKIFEVVLRRAGSQGQSELVTDKQINLVLYLILQGYCDDVNHSTGFAKKMESLEIIKLLHHAKSKCAETSDMLRYVLERTEECRLLILHPSSVGPSLRATTGKSLKKEAPAIKSDEELARQRKADAAAKRRKKAMEQMSALQARFLRENASELKTVDSGIAGTRSRGNVSEPMEFGKTLVAVSAKKAAQVFPEISYTCILCKEITTPEHENGMLFASYCRGSSVLSGLRQEGCLSTPPKFRKDFNLDSGLDFGLLVRSCGHAMHHTCFKDFFKSLVEKERQNRRDNGPFRTISNYDVMKREYLCPLCERLCNNTVPLLPSSSKLYKSESDPESKMSSLSFAQWLQQQEKEAEQKASDLRASLELTLDAVPPQFRLGLGRFQLTVNCRETIPPMWKQAADSFVNNNNKSNFGDAFTSTDNQYRTRSVFQACAMAMHFSQAENEAKPILHGTTEREQDFLRALVRLTSDYPLLQDRMSQPVLTFPLAPDSDIVSAYMLAMNWFTDFPSLLEIDSVYVLIALSTGSPMLTAVAEKESLQLDLHNDHVVRFALVLTLAQILLGYNGESRADEYFQALPTATKEENKAIKRLWKQVCDVTGKPESFADVNSGFAVEVKLRLLRFLRCAALYFHYRNDVPLPCQDSFDFATLTEYLGLNGLNFSELLSQDGVSYLLDGYERYARFIQSDAAKRSKVPNLPCQFRHLKALPLNYASLLDVSAGVTCSNNRSGECKYPTMCLICKKILCAQSNCCNETIKGKKVGSCTGHAHRCGADNGIFLRLGRCDIVILADMGKAPYLDDFGEPDKDLRRGNPLTLSQSQFDDLDRLWLTGNISDRISRNFNPNIPFVLNPTVSMEF